MNNSPLKTSGTVALSVVRESCTFSRHPYIGRIARLSLREHGFLVYYSTGLVIKIIEILADCNSVNNTGLERNHKDLMTTKFSNRRSDSSAAVPEDFGGRGALRKIRKILKFLIL